MSSVAPRDAVTTTQASSTFIDVVLPTAQANDYLTVHIRVPNTGSNFTIPTGWTRHHVATDGVGMSLHVFGKPASGTETSPVRWKFPVTQTFSAAAVSWQPVDTTAPVDVKATAGQAASSIPTAASVTTTKANDLVVTGFTTSGTAPAGMTEVAKVAGLLDVFYVNQAAAGATGAKALGTGATNNWAASTITLAVRPNQTPNAATGLAPNGTTIDRTTVQRFSGTFSDPDAGDSSSALDIQYRLVGAGTWTTVSATTPNRFLDFAAGTFASGSYEWQMRYTDAQGAVGPWSASAFFTASTPPATPTITAPAAGSTVAVTPSAVTWSTPTQDAYEVRRVKDVAGSPDTTTVYFDTGTVTDAVSRTLSTTFETNSRYEHVQVRVRASGLWSAWASVRVFVSWTAPAVANVTVTVGARSIAVAYSQPAPSGSQPAVASVNVWVNENGTGSKRLARGLPVTGTWVFETPASGKSYTFRVEAVGTSTATSFTAETG